MARLASEDEPMLRGEAQFTADLPVPAGTLHLSFVRSQVAHGRNLTLDTTAALAAPGVAAVFGHDDLGAPPVEFYTETSMGGLMARPLLADGTVRFVGEPVAVVAAESPTAALDAAEFVVVDIEPLQAVTDPEAAAADDAPLLFPDAGTNVVKPLRADAAVIEVAGATGAGGPGAAGLPDGARADPCEGAAFVAELVCENPRVASAPIEPCAILAIPAAAHSAAPVLDVWCTGQGTHPPRDTLAASLAVEPEQVRVRHPLVGGGFGGRGDALVEFLVAAHCARRLGRPVRWVQSRTEQFFALPYGRGQRHRIRLGLSADGDIVGLDATMWADAGAYPHMGPMLAAAGRRQCSGMYRVPRLRYRYGAAVTNAPPVGAYRGAGQPEVNAALERAVDAAARLAGLDPVEVRRRNLLTPDDLPYDTGLGITIDSGDPVAALDAALDAVDAPRRRVEAAARRAAGAARVVGIGVGCYSQTAGSGDDPDFARLDLDADGTVHVSCSSSAHGQGHHSMWARLASAELGIAAGSVRVTDSDSAATRFGVSTGGSRSTFVLGSQIATAARLLRGRVVEVAARLLEASPDDVVTAEAGAHVAGVPSRAVSWAELAAAAAGAAAGGTGLSAESADRLGGPTHPYGTHASVVEVDVETGAVVLLAHAAVDDCGVALDVESVVGQQHGGAAAGISQALMEAAVGDDDGTPLTTTFADYLIASATSLPMIATRRPGIPTERNLLGARGIGENGAIAAPPAVQNAVVDALAHLGVTHVDIPLTPERVRRAVVAAGRTADANPRT